MSEPVQQSPRALTIAGSDSGGGAGIQADLKTFAALGVYGCTALTAVTAQNTIGVRAVQELPAALVAAQIDAVLEDIGAGAVKTGMLASSAIIEAVADCLRRYSDLPLVVDPVMVAKSGDRLLAHEAIRTLQDKLLPLAFLVTPNIPEAEVLAGMPITGVADLGEAARRIAANGAAHVLIKGGHLPGPPVDYLWDRASVMQFPGERVTTTSTHGTGCTLSAAITAQLARGAPLRTAIQVAKTYVTEALRHATPIGGGCGPLEHFWRRTIGTQGQSAERQAASEPQAGRVGAG
jgi:hydroxymethylpyrimidine/phosphomethylpyrimidine kinase